MQIEKLLQEFDLDVGRIYSYAVDCRFQLLSKIVENDTAGFLSQCVKVHQIGRIGRCA